VTDEDSDRPCDICEHRTGATHLNWYEICEHCVGRAMPSDAPDPRDAEIARLTAERAEALLKLAGAEKGAFEIARGLGRLMVSVQRNAPPVLARCILAVADVEDPVAIERSRALAAEAALSAALADLAKERERREALANRVRGIG